MAVNKTTLLMLFAMLMAPMAVQAQSADKDASPEVSEQATKGPGGIGEIAFSGGWKWPLDDVRKFGDDGFTGWLRFNFHMPGSESVSLIGVAGGTFFAQQSEAVIVTGGGGATFPAERTLKQYELSLNIGPQFGSASRSGVFRPRIAVAPGIYLFNSESDVRLTGDTENLIDDAVSLIRFGWKGVAGTDLFFSQKWGISLDFVYDAIWNLEFVESVDSTGTTTNTGTARYAGFLVGVVIPFEAMD